MAKKEKKNLPSLGETWAVSRRALGIIRTYAPGLVPVLTMQAVTQAVTPYAAVWFSARLLGELAGARRPEALTRWAVLTVCVTGALALLGHLLDNLAQARNIFFLLRRNWVQTDKMKDMDYAVLERQETQDLLQQVRQNENWGGSGIRKTVVLFQRLLKSFIGIVTAAVLCAGLFVSRISAEQGLAWLDGPLGILALALGIALPTALSSFIDNRFNNKVNGIAMADTATLGNRIFGAYGFMCFRRERALDVRVFDQHRIARYHMAHDRVFSPEGPIGRLYAGWEGFLESVSSGLSALPTGFVYVYVCLKALAGAFGVGEASQYIGAITSLTGNVRDFLENLSLIRQNASYVKLALEFLDIPNEMYRGTLTTEKRSDRQYDVEFRDVSFKYPGSDNWALRHVSVRFKVGTRLAVVGENGSGKTTFIKLLCRLYDPQEGEILLNGIDIKKYNYRDYMSIFSVVFQDYNLISQPLGANVAGSAEYDRERVTRALTDAGFGQRLSELPDGLDTQLYRDYDGEGVQISGGEAQKIAIARALYKDSPFIILDEPTAALDPVAEAEIYAQFNEISGDKTAIYISHRLSSCRFCDDILVFDHGQIVQQGSHDALVADERGEYHKLWHAQAQYYTNLQ